MKVEAEAVRRWLAREKNTRWLMVFNNIDRDVQSDEEDTQAYRITSFLPAADHGSVLITTRLPSLGEMGKPTEVGRLGLDPGIRAPQRSVRLAPIKQWYGKGAPFECDKLIDWFADMNNLVQRLGYLPLALVQAGTYMRETKTGCSKYLELYESSWLQLAAETPRLRDYENGSIQTT